VKKEKEKKYSDQMGMARRECWNYLNKLILQEQSFYLKSFRDGYLGPFFFTQ